MESVASYLPYVDKIVIVDLGSTDGTYEILQQCAQNDRIEVYSRPWDLASGPSALKTAWEHHREFCAGADVLHIEADEVLDSALGKSIQRLHNSGCDDLRIIRYQVEQNFQRIRWGGTPCHRLWPAASEFAESFALLDT